jgi:thiol:disulfide interchange protein
MLLSLLIALNLAGLFELRGPTFTSAWLGRGGGSSAFGTGALAALIATPCSGPFMGVALGAALLLPTPAALLIFAGLGAGMALPFLLLAFAPQIQRRLPKPGTWMITFRRILAIPMLATALGLAWVLGRQSGVDGLSIGLVIATLTALGLWWIGLRQMRGVRVSYALAPLALAMVLAVSVDLAPASAAAVAVVDEREPFSEARLAELRASGTPVFVDFTADWCLICQVNERVAIDRSQTRAAFEKAGVVVLEGDWTNGDPAITRFLAKHGRNSIPFYLYADQAGNLRELPQILSSDLLVEAAQGS